MDFAQRIADARSVSDKAFATYNDEKDKADAAYDQYNQSFNQRQNYGDYYSQARNQYLNTNEMNKLRGTYQSARDAVDQVNTTINKLPESISQQYGGTGLTEAQRARAYQGQVGALQNTLNNVGMTYQNAMTDYDKAKAMAMQEVFNVAQGNYGSQEDALNAQRSVWNALLNNRNTVYGQYQQALGQLADQYGARDQWQLAQDQMALERWKEEQANARAKAERDSAWNLQTYLRNRQNEANSAQAELRAKMQEAAIKRQNALDIQARSQKELAEMRSKNTFGNNLKSYLSDVLNAAGQYKLLALFGGGTQWHWDKKPKGSGGGGV